MDRSKRRNRKPLKPKRNERTIHYRGINGVFYWSSSRNVDYEDNIQRKMKQKTPIQELIDWLNSLIAVLPEGAAKNQLIIARNKAESMLEKEKEAMCQFADEFAIECINFHHEKTMSPEQFFNLTFNPKDK